MSTFLDASLKEMDATQLLKPRLSEISQGAFRSSDYKKITIDDLCQDLISVLIIRPIPKSFFGGTAEC